MLAVIIALFVAAFISAFGKLYFIKSARAAKQKRKWLVQIVALDIFTYGFIAFAMQKIAEAMRGTSLSLLEYYLSTEGLIPLLLCAALCAKAIYLDFLRVRN